MRLTRKVVYAVRILSKMEDLNRIYTVSELSKNMPKAFCERILIQLKKAGIVASIRGAHGGYKLLEPVNKVSIADIIEATDGFKHTLCIYPHKKSDTCYTRCLCGKNCEKIYNELKGIFSRITVKDYASIP